jgi:succinoglycan biosynthesis protein ExoL
LNDVTLQVLYLAHDLADPAIRRRVLTLKTGGASVTVAGFMRAGNLLGQEDGVRSIDLGSTQDGQFSQRIKAVIAARMQLQKRLVGVPMPDVIIARNLEMLVLAEGAASLFGGDVPVVYECLDIHRLLLDEGVKGRVLRAVQRHFAKSARLLITSSPAFVENFFKPKSGLDLPVLLLENKVLQLGEASVAKPEPRLPKQGEPWKIGWFGAIRCRKSLDILSAFAEQMNGGVEVIIRGRPAYSEFADFDAQVKNAPFVRFEGPYRNPEDLASIYNEVQFTWAIDFFEEGLNSEWLLPNRLYEGGLHGAVPIALSRTETGRFVAKRDIGILLDNATPSDLETLFSGMTDALYLDRFTRLAAVDRSQWVTDADHCRALVHRLAGLNRNNSLAVPSVPAVSTVQS